MVQLKKKVKLKQKQSPKRNWFSEHFTIILGILVGCIILAIVFVPRGCTNGETPHNDTLVADTLTKDPVPPVDKDSLKSDSAITTQKVAEDPTLVGPESVTEGDEPTGNKAPFHDVANISENVDAEALSVIRGNYGNNPERRRLLKDKYQKIQNKVNEMYRNGQVK